MPQNYGPVDELVQELVIRLGFKANSIQWRKAKDFALNTFKNHRFLSVDSHKLHRKVDGLCDKFDIHAQYAKARELRRLCTAFYETVQLDTLDECDKQPLYSVIDLLTHLSNNPTSQYEYTLPEKRTVAVRHVEDSTNWRELLLDGEPIKSFSPSESENEQDSTDGESVASSSNEPDLNDSSRQIANVLKRIAKCVSDSTAQQQNNDAKQAHELMLASRSSAAFFSQSETLKLDESEIRAALSISLDAPTVASFSERRFVLDCALALSGVRNVHIMSLFSVDLRGLDTTHGDGNPRARQFKPFSMEQFMQSCVLSNLRTDVDVRSVFQRTSKHVSPRCVMGALHRFVAYACVVAEVRAYFDSVLRTTWNPDVLSTRPADCPPDANERDKATLNRTQPEAALFSPTAYRCVEALSAILRTYFDQPVYDALLRDSQVSAGSLQSATGRPHTFLTLTHNIDYQLAARQTLRTLATVRNAIQSIFLDELRTASMGRTPEHVARLRRMVKARAAVRLANWLHQAAQRGRVESFATRVLVCTYVRTLRAPLDALDAALRGACLRDDRTDASGFDDELFVLAGRQSAADRSLLDLDFAYFWQHRFVTLADLLRQRDPDCEMLADCCSDSSPEADCYRPLFLPRRLVRRLIVAFKLVDFLRKFGLVGSAFSFNHASEHENEMATLYDALCQRLEKMLQRDSQWTYLLRLTNARSSHPVPPRSIAQRVTDLSDENSHGHERVGEFLAVADEPLAFLRTALHPLVHQRCERLIGRVNRVLCAQFRLATHFRYAQGVFLMRFGDAMHQFATSVFRSFDDAASASGAPADGSADLVGALRNRLLQCTNWSFNAAQLSGALQSALADSSFCRTAALHGQQDVVYPPIAECFFVQLPSDSDSCVLARSALLVDTLSLLTVHYCAPPILSILFNQETRCAYNRVLQFLLKVKWARCAVLSTYFDSTLLRCGSLTATAAASRSHAHAMLVRRFGWLRMRFQAFTNAIESFVNARVTLVTQRTRIASITDESCDIDELISAHAGYLQRLLGACLQTESTRVLLDAVTRLLELSVLFGHAFGEAHEHFLTTSSSSADGQFADTQAAEQHSLDSFARWLSAFVDSFNQAVTFLTVIVGQILARSEYSAEADRFYEALLLIDDRYR